MGKNCYPKVFLEERKYIAKKKKMSKYTDNDLELSSDNSDKEVSDEEVSYV